MAAHSSADAPEHYPWPGAGVEAAMLHRDGVRELDARAGLGPMDETLRGDGAAPLADRTLVVAVGSNQSPAVIASKYRRFGLVGPVTTPFLRCTVQELAVGHSAHVSARGYIAAAPHDAPGARTEFVATWFDAAQLEVIDRSEPNYERIELTAADHPSELSTGDRPARFEVYASRWGVIADRPPLPVRVDRSAGPPLAVQGRPHGRTPLAFQPAQQDLFGLLGALTGADAFSGEAAEICARLAWDPAAIGTLLRERALVVPDGLPRPLPPGEDHER